MALTGTPSPPKTAELPENLKVLFRYCAMIRPDLDLICENMLMAEGFKTARPLSIKFVTLYSLSSALLSPQAHYDWGLRAVKSVLRVAGAMKRASPDQSEDRVLMRALRDFNTPKIPNTDLPIFSRLILDLFPFADSVPRDFDEVLKAKVLKACDNKGLQKDYGFVKKVIEFQELLDVRHSVMLIGPAGCGKSTIWQTLQDSHNLEKPKPTCVASVLEPKAVTGDELYGYVNLAKEWSDGCLSIIMRGMAKNFHEQGFYDFQTYKWVVLDGDIDAVWIESMNTVMDDNKVLTLVSNERIPLSSAMRMIFEIDSLKNATPATVSRAGILYINESDVGWKPFVDTWCFKQSDEAVQNYVPQYFEHYVPAFLEATRKGYKTVAPVKVMSMVMTTCYLIEAALKENKAIVDEKLVNTYFIWAFTWAFAGGYSQDKNGDMVSKISEYLSSDLFKDAKQPLPGKEMSFLDCFIDAETGKWRHWNEIVDKYMMNLCLLPNQVGSRPENKGPWP